MFSALPNGRMKTLIYQHFTPDKRIKDKKKNIYFKCMSTVERYANNIGCDYIQNNRTFIKGYHPVWECFRILEDNMFLEYDKVLFIDADVFAPNTDDNRIFENYDGFVACKVMTNERTRTRPEYTKYGPDFFNSGVMLIDRESNLKLRELDPVSFREQYKNVVPGRDQLALNMMAKQAFGGYTQFDPDDACYFTEPNMSKAIFVHVAGRLRSEYTKDEQRWDKLFDVNT
jgi:lipopolysaccharide biosynthesis glycosyltransferase